jgi:hypothetical protein
MFNKIAKITKQLLLLRGPKVRGIKEVPHLLKWLQSEKSECRWNMMGFYGFEWSTGEITSTHNVRMASQSD